MAEPARKRATYEDILAAPPHVVAELIEGVLHTQPRPAARHTRAASKMGIRIGGSFDEDDEGGGHNGPGGWWILDEPELHLGENVLVPDLAGWRRARMPVIPDEPYFTLPPDWVCEVLSPSTRRLDVTVKADLYAAAGIGHFWQVDPDAKTLTVFELSDGRWLRVVAFAGDDSAIAPPFEAVPLPLSALWLPDPPGQGPG
ncbi:MAG: Uma2 family endonuclease [Neomegalonema sp.]|nr:Uma2 family endonuclease [Neomegalonema sp.]